jgi:uncharacterized LabA/DUF88 family protein
MHKEKMTKRLMIFVDGTNLLTQLSKEIKVPSCVEKPTNAILEYSNVIIDKYTKAFVTNFFQRDEFTPYVNTITIRRYWFSSYKGSEDIGNNLKTELRCLGFEPVLFKKRGEREKGVDIALTREMLINAFNQNFDIGFLITGDEDYVELVKDVKRYGQIVGGGFFKNGLSKHLKVEFDHFIELKVNTSNDKKFIDNILSTMHNNKQ